MHISLSLRRFSGYAIAVSSTCLATALIVFLNQAVKIPNISLLYIPVILMTAVYFGTGASLVAATVAVLEYDFFLLRPVFTLTIAQAQDVLAFVIFVIVAVLTGQLAASARQRAEAAQRRAAESMTLYELGQALMNVREIPQVLDAITERIVAVFGVDHCAIFVPDVDGRLQLAAEAVQQARRPPRVSAAAANFVFKRGTEVGLPTDDPEISRLQRVYVPLKTADRIVGVMEVGPKRSGDALDPEARRLVTSFAAQAALSIARAQTEEERHRLEVLEQTDKLKSALLSAVSHDLRTPLSSIKASATALLLADASWSEADGREFLQTIDQEADKLNRLVGNLLDLSRIEAGVLRPVLDWYDVAEIIDTILPRVRALVAFRPFEIDIQRDLPPVKIDLLRIETLVVNLLENAVKYTPEGSAVTLKVWQDATGLHIAVVDMGPGVPGRDHDRIFNTFYRSQEHSDRNPGTGLGLAICRGVAEAHGGNIRVKDTPGGGATFVVSLPSSLIGSKVLT